ncbi:formimidoylglutamase [Shewanella schlegeliana]|uniref:Formimidoylglutamase n=1 Tax=Shewanella schlegeliana TaxID=190308 RepID=A0ABS1SWV7_9GAMM|nr:formimidoylglutamase [Shewanella schlegeliana]MBL4913038.1 formimidoylglutamase [Shewanella schlegeliana]MCL1108866.1 formimidoylglutamase [Shewanella schlegeliana]GIU23937.1 formimidoylglutamase HutG [Shewanella schlegeliana]
MQYLNLFNTTKLASLLNTREGETKLGQVVQLADASQDLNTNLTQAKANGARFVIIGIGEDIGPRANLGRGGANDAFDSAMAQFLNLQSNRFLSGEQCIVLGQVDTQDLQLPANASTESLRSKVEQLDLRVITLLTQVFSAGLEPIVIGGGHNNAYGLLMAAKAGLKRPIAAVNLDPHSDFRPKEGRHSGNGFSYAAASGALGYYHVLGLHELKNSETTLEQLKTFGGHWHSLQQIWIRRELSVETAVKSIAKDLNNTQLPVAIEVDLDAITNMPSSASTAAGVPLLDALFYVSYIAKHCPTAYLHLAEAAPSCHVAGAAAGHRETGQSISELLYSYISGRINAL